MKSPVLGRRKAAFCVLQYEQIFGIWVQNLMLRMLLVRNRLYSSAALAGDERLSLLGDVSTVHFVISPIALFLVLIKFISTILEMNFVDRMAISIVSFLIVQSVWQQFKYVLVFIGNSFLFWFEWASVTDGLAKDPFSVRVFFFGWNPTFHAVFPMEQPWGGVVPRRRLTATAWL